MFSFISSAFSPSCFSSFLVIDKLSIFLFSLFLALLVSLVLSEFSIAFIMSFASSFASNKISLAFTFASLIMSCSCFFNEEKSLSSFIFSSSTLFEFSKIFCFSSSAIFLSSYMFFNNSSILISSESKSSFALSIIFCEIPSF